MPHIAASNIVDIPIRLLLAPKDDYASGLVDFKEFAMKDRMLERILLSLSPSWLEESS
ncbi:hypothetical protein F441_08273 [Phytophthora nicotianae CJ01A1]|uniref:Uncharacterized protein n=4 Tax=Phytophthora nicotianae TaxID=4792 RepID=W2Q9R0_PHYN3|nr:hypothetical protein PPTG_22854 [Phytophthora nicotianae INRA-310]ETK87449.1 hypothetical protein L915_08122 [Phytophthora nicotianae]ETP17305.1 hypothetical protein F441_08273 [Phytophthora nicotianae CJ01A1]ETP45356.1 hypothetical protein F442_08236 [Phytophthora nicotianae P10297]ETL40873.1 hypothetical protein L916_08044 [Phytophthora nicotianae]ETN09913.1 hypothetical protein PPTG_22854 [Phytophthora nicotianae INRA-310]